MPEPIIIKRCPKCKQIKPTSEFHKNMSHKDNLSNWCKLCNLDDSKKYRQTEKGRLVQKRYGRSEKHKIVQKRYYQSEKGREKYRQNARKYRQTEQSKVARKRYQQSEKGKQAQRRYRGSRKYRVNSEKRKARDAINNAVKADKLPRANTLQCHYGNHPAQQYHHWHGYEPKHWLDVIPVCILCHNL